MFGLFKKKRAKSPEDRISELERKGDWAGLARAYYEMGAAAMDRGELERAQLWLHRADAICSADDAVYEKVGEGLTGNCSDRIGVLEEKDRMVYNAVPAEIQARARELSDPQLRIWGMLSIARLARLGERLAALPGCQVLGELGWAVDMMFASLQQAPSQEEHQRLMDVCNGLYELGDSQAFYGGGEIEAAGGAPFQVFDLNGMGVLLELNSCMDNHLRLLAALSQDQEDLPGAESGVVACALLPDYYVRTGTARLKEVPQIKAELERIWSDYDTVRNQLPLGEIRRKIGEYKQMDILA